MTDSFLSRSTACLFSSCNTINSTRASATLSSAALRGSPLKRPTISIPPDAPSPIKAASLVSAATSSLASFRDSIAASKASFNVNSVVSLKPEFMSLRSSVIPLTSSLADFSLSSKVSTPSPASLAAFLERRKYPATAVRSGIMIPSAAPANSILPPNKLITPTSCVAC